MTNLEYEDSIKWKVGDLKKVNIVAGAPAKSLEEMIKRIVVGFFVLSCFVCPMYIHPFADVLYTSCFVHKCNSEIFSIGHNTKDWVDIFFRYA